MAHIHPRKAPRTRVLLALAAILAAVVAAPASVQAADPDNDDYETPRVANLPGSVFQHNSPVEWSIGPAAPPGQDTTGTIDEADNQTGGMGDTSNTAENLNCVPPFVNAPLTKTVWYWVFPDVSGFVQINTSGGDAVVRLLGVNPGSGVTGGNNTPQFANARCVDDANPAAPENLIVGVVGGAGARYAIQVGVYNASPTFGAWGAGTHLTRITFYRDRDLDETFDPNDRCPTTDGPAALQGCPDSDGDKVVNIDDRCPTAAGPSTLRGCPDSDGDGIANVDDRCATENARSSDANRNGCLDLRKFGANVVSMPNSTLFSLSRGRFVRNGVKITKLSVSGLPSGTSVQVSCSKRSICRKQTKRGRRVSFGKLKGKRLRPGRSVVVRVSKSGYVTRRYVIKAKAKGKRGVSRSSRCVIPGTKRLTSCSKVSTVR